MIKLQVIGNLGKDCIVKEVNGKTVINFSVAHSERYKDAQGNQKERTTWVECAYWTDKTAVAQYLTIFSCLVVALAIINRAQPREPVITPVM